VSTLTPTGTGRRSPLPWVVLVLFALVVGAAGGWWFAGRSDKGSPAAHPTASVSCTPHATATGPHAALPAPSTITVNVFNATTRTGLARDTSRELAARGFKIGVVANDPLHKVIPTSAEIRYGPSGVRQAKVVAAQVPLPRLVQDRRTTAVVDFVIGEGFTALSPPAQVRAQLSAHPTATSAC
jgi:hypothetical protein